MSTNLVLISQEDLKEIVKEAVTAAFEAEKQGNPETDILTSREAEALLKVSKPTLIEWRKNGLVPYHRTGSRLYFKKSELLQCLRKVTQKH